MKAHRYWPCRLFGHRWKKSESGPFDICKRNRCGMTWPWSDSWRAKHGRRPWRG